MRPAALVDSNVLLDVITDDPRWAAWSAEAIRSHLHEAPLAINAIVFGELAFAADRIEDLRAALPKADFVWLDIPPEAAFLAARAHAAYRSRGGRRQMILPDILIGAHALIEGLPLLTRDHRRYRTSFPALTLITPER